MCFNFFLRKICFNFFSKLFHFQRKFKIHKLDDKSKFETQHLSSLTHTHTHTHTQTHLLGRDESFQLLLLSFQIRQLASTCNLLILLQIFNKNFYNFRSSVISGILLFQFSLKFHTFLLSTFLQNFFLLSSDVPPKLVVALLCSSRAALIWGCIQILITFCSRPWWSISYRCVALVVE